MVRRFLLVLLLAGLTHSVTYAQPAEDPARQLFLHALVSFESGAFSVAAEQFNRLRTRYPDDDRAADALFYEAESLLATGNDDRAVELFGLFDALYPDHPFAFGTRLSLGRYFFEAGQYDQAIETLSEVVDESPTAEESAKALYWMGESAIRMNRNQEAFRYLNRIVDEFAQTETAPRAAYAIAFNHVRLEQYDRAARAFERLADRFPQSDYAQNIGLALAEVYYEIDDFQRTADEIERQLPNLDGDGRDRAIFLLAESYNQLRNSQEAILNYRHFTEGDTDNPYYRRALYGLAWNYHHEETWQWAADNFRAVYQADDSDDLAAESMYYEAVNLRLARSVRDAIATFGAYVDRYPEHDLADHGLFELGIALYQQRRWSEALDPLQRLRDEYPDSDLRGEGLLRLGNVHVALGNFDAALSAFDEAISLDAAPASLRSEITFQKAWLLYRNRRYEEAAPQFMQLFEGGTADVDAEESLFWAAESYFQLENFQRAETLFARYIENYPGARHADAARYALGWTHFRQGEYELAVPQFEQFLNAYREESGTVPYRADAQLRLADSYFALKRYSDAVRVYGRMSAGGDDYALYQIGQAYSNAGDAFQAISTFRDLLERYPTSEWREEASYQLGYLYFLNQEYEQAIEAYRSLISSWPLDPLAAKAQYGIGDAHFNAGRIDQAVSAYRTVLTEYPDSPFTADAAAGIQFALMADGRTDDADAVVDSLISAMPGSRMARELRFRQAEAKYQSGLTVEALSDFETFLEDSDDPQLRADALYYIATIHQESEDVGAARRAWSLILEEHPESDRAPAAGIALGNILLDNGEAFEALDVFTSTEERAGSDQRIRILAEYGRSRALSLLGRQDEARDLLDVIVQESPDASSSNPAWLGLAKLDLAAGDTTRAILRLERVVRSARDDTGAEALYMLGSVQLQNGQPAVAVETLGRMSVLFAGYPEWMAKGYLRQAEAFEDLDDTGEAIRILELVVTNYPDTESADEAASRLEDLR